MSEYIYNYLGLQNTIVNTIGTIDDLIEKNGEILRKLMHFSDLLFKNYMMNSNDLMTIKLGDNCDIKTGKLNAEAADDNGVYPFFTCGKEELAINNFAFDGPSIIIAGNGEISCKYYNGKFNAYQRTYVLQPRKYFYLFAKACESNIDELKNNSQGSVIKFITKGMLENISIKVNDNSIVTNNKIKLLYDKISAIQNRIKKLKKIKELLLSKYF